MVNHRRGGLEVKDRLFAKIQQVNHRIGGLEAAFGTCGFDL